jgi:hypothetical protein
MLAPIFTPTSNFFSKETTNLGNFIKKKLNETLGIFLIMARIEHKGQACNVKDFE